MSTTTAPEEFRQKISTVDGAGKRLWVYPKKQGGRFFNARLAVSVVLLALLFAGPWITVNGRPLYLLNIFKGRLVLFGNPFFPTDFYLIALGAIIFFVFIILFTVIYGRIWCGWACPQTLFMEMVFRRIDYWIEGDAAAQRRLDAQPWNGEKLIKKTLKYSAYALISLLISHTVMAYLVGIEEVRNYITHAPSDNLAGFVGLVAFTGLFFFVFAYLREQVCTVICPYGRLQGVLIDKKTAQVSYDFVRGEPRGKKSTTTADCIDCSLCVQVCPTGIDIRNGSQLECINCTACMDACDAVMLKLNRPAGLIRIDSQEGITEGKRFTFSRRVAAYTAVLAVLLVIEGFLFVHRAEVDTTVMRVPGMMYQKMPDGRIANLYNIQLVNKTYDRQRIRFSSPGTEAEIRLVGDSMDLQPAQKGEAVVFIILPKDQLKPGKMRVPIQVHANGHRVAETTTTFFSPAN